MFGSYSLVLTAYAITLFSHFPSAYAIPPGTVETCVSPSIRREWGDLGKIERKDYIGAVRCLKEKPSSFGPGIVPGSRSRYDDFAAVHINQTINIHFDGVFLAWHRNFLWLWETALREECGYKGYQPYWDWPKWVAHGKLSQNPLFDGSETSLSGDGLPDSSYNGTFLGALPGQTGPFIPKGKGGGCVKDGPFVNWTVSMGPFSFSDAYNGLPDSWKNYTPHCLRRDLNDDEAQFLNYTYFDSILSKDTIADFQGNLTNFDGMNQGIHNVGHFVLGPGVFDFFASPGDPAFFLHHGGVDRFWTMWQDIDPKRRMFGDNALNGTLSFLNAPSTAEVNFETVVNWSVLGKEKTLGELMNVRGGDFCYEYA